MTSEAVACEPYRVIIVYLMTWAYASFDVGAGNVSMHAVMCRQWTWLTGDSWRAVGRPGMDVEIPSNVSVYQLSVMIYPKQFISHDVSCIGRSIYLSVMIYPKQFIDACTNPYQL